MIYTQKQVLEVLRKHPASSLWNYNHIKWNERQKSEFEQLKTGVIIPVYKKERITRINAQSGKPRNCESRYKKVKRISDGKIYQSVGHCARENGLSPTTISRSVNGNHENKRFELVDN